MRVLRRAVPGRHRGIPLKSGTEPVAQRDLIVYNARIVDRDLDSRGAVLVRDGKISAVYLGEEGGGVLSSRHDIGTGKGPELIDAAGSVLMPAFVDLHAHFRDPGYTHKETLETGSLAAVAGGYGTVVLMANTNPVVSDAAAAAEVCARAGKIGLVDVFQAVSLTRGFDGKDTSGLETVDASLVPLVTEDGREVSSSAVMLQAMEVCAHRGLLVSCHCEDPELAGLAGTFREAAMQLARSGSLNAGNMPADHLEKLDLSARFSSISASADFEPVHANLSSAERLLRLAENIMTGRNLALAAAAACRIHIAHVRTRGADESVSIAKASRPGFVSCEVTPHHLALTDLVPAIVNPPLRSEADRLALISALVDGTIDAIATDHAPHTAADKAAGAPGFSGLETAFALCHTTLVKTEKISLSRLSALMSANPASLLSLRKGLIRTGYDADFVLVDPERKWTVNPFGRRKWYSLGTNTPISGSILTGMVLSGYKYGRKVFG